MIPSLTLRFENTEGGGLGEPLPGGVVRVFESYAGREVLAGEADVGDRPVGLPVELEIRPGVEDYYTDVDVEQSSRPMRRKYGDLAWRFTVPPGEEQLRYEVSALEQE